MTETLHRNSPPINSNADWIGGVASKPAYVGLWVNVRHRFGPRFPEWVMSGHMVLYGFVLTWNSDLFSQPTFSMFKAIFVVELYLGLFIGGVGLARFGGLIVNGARKKVTPAIRQVSAAAGFIIWVGLTYCYASSGIFSTWFSIYPVFAVTELVNIYRAAHDQGEVSNGRSN